MKGNDVKVEEKRSELLSRSKDKDTDKDKDKDAPKEKTKEKEKPRARDREREKEKDKKGKHGSGGSLPKRKKAPQLPQCEFASEASLNPDKLAISVLQRKLDEAKEKEKKYLQRIEELENRLKGCDSSPSSGDSEGIAVYVGSL